MRIHFVPLALLLTLPGCFGSFELTKAVHGFNQDVSDSFVVQEIVFLVMIVVPVYEVSAFVDAVVLNTIEALTGDNPIGEGPPESRVVQVDGGTLTVIPDGAGVRLELDRQGARQVRRLRRRARRLEVVEGDVVVASMERADDGGLWVDVGEGPRHVARSEVLLATAP